MTCRTSSTYSMSIPSLTDGGTCPGDLCQNALLLKSKVRHQSRTLYSMSALLAAGAKIFFIPARCAARIFSLSPPTGRTCPASVNSPVIAMLAHLSAGCGTARKAANRLTKVGADADTGEQAQVGRQNSNTGRWALLEAIDSVSSHPVRREQNERTSLPIEPSGICRWMDFFSVRSCPAASVRPRW